MQGLVNDDWRDRLLATTSWLAGNSELIEILDRAGMRLSVDNQPQSFLCP